MLIKTPNPNHVINYETTLLKSPTDPDYGAPIILVDPRGITQEQEELLLGLTQFTPATKFRAGDLAMLRGAVPKKLTVTVEKIPRVWEVRFVVSRWMMEAMLTLHSSINVQGLDHLIDLIESHGGLPKYLYDQPVIYAHGYPHGIYPNTAAWLAEWNLKRLAIRDPVMPWANIVNGHGAAFLGYDTTDLVAPFQFEYAPNNYGEGNALTHPFAEEEAGVQTLCSSGLEEYLFDPIIIGQTRRLKNVDPDNDVFRR